MENCGNDFMVFFYKLKFHWLDVLDLQPLTTQEAKSKIVYKM